MELRHLRYFVAVADELHFRRAAERLHVAQPAVSEQIRKLEQELGVRLFDRDQRKVELTDAGAAMLVEARRVLLQADVARQAARGARAITAQRLRVGYLPDALPTVIHQALRTLATGTPNIHTTLETGPALGLVDAVRTGRLDAAVVCLPAPTRGLRKMGLGTLRAVAVLPAGDPRAVLPEIDLAKLAPERLVVLPRAGNPAFYDAIVATCRAADCSPTLVELPDADVAHALLAVSAGAGMALLPDSVADRYSAPGIRLRPVAGSGLDCETAVVTRPDVVHAPTAALLHALHRSGHLRALADARPAAPAVVAASVPA
jgi:DNA-binding transcriptional LysR family regulator